MLQNVIERSVVLSKGSVLKLGADLLPIETSYNVAAHQAAYEPEPAVTLENIQRQHILRVLDQTGWLMSGPNGAAAILNVHPNPPNAGTKHLVSALHLEQLR